jgi:SAM-dependent methyltransferase
MKMTAVVAGQETPEASESAEPWQLALRDELDPNSKRRLAALDPRPDWHCLEIGAGSGTVARWLAERCTSGRVVATDISLDALDGPPVPNLDVIRHDVTTEEFPEESFDLVYARYVFSHLRSRESDLARIVSWLKPGGWLLLEEPAQFPIESAAHATYRDVSLATLVAYREHVGTDLTWPRTFPAPLVRLGLDDVGMDGSLSLVGGGRPMALFWVEAVKGWGPVVVEAGGATEEQVAEVVALMHRKDFCDLGLATVAAWGRRPPVV